MSSQCPLKGPCDFTTGHSHRAAGLNEETASSVTTAWGLSCVCVVPSHQAYLSVCGGGMELFSGLLFLRYRNLLQPARPDSVIRTLGLLNSQNRIFSVM